MNVHTVKEENSWRWWGQGWGGGVLQGDKFGIYPRHKSNGTSQVFHIKYICIMTEYQIVLVLYLSFPHIFFSIIDHQSN